MATANTLIHSLKIILMSSGALFIAILISLSLNPILTSAASELPTFWSRLAAWLRPPYLYVIINCIIITIAASSRLHQNHHAPSPQQVSPHAPPKFHSRAEQFSPYDAVPVAEDSFYGDVSVKEDDVEVVKSEERERRIVDEEVVKAPVEEFEIPEVKLGGEREDSAVTADDVSTWTPSVPLERQPPVEVSPEFFFERPPASSRFGNNRRPAKATPAEGGKTLRRVAKPKKHETLEATWKAITEGRAMPLTRHLKSKSQTWEAQGRQMNFPDFSSDDHELPVKKSETFKDRTNYVLPPVPSSRLRKEPLLGQDELNRRVEAFINKFNEEIRLQRQQSIEQFMDKINRI